MGTYKQGQGGDGMRKARYAASMEQIPCLRGKLEKSANPSPGKAPEKDEKGKEKKSPREKEKIKDQEKEKSIEQEKEKGKEEEKEKGKESEKEKVKDQEEEKEKQVLITEVQQSDFLQDKTRKEKRE